MRPCSGTSELRFKRGIASVFVPLLVVLSVASGCASKRPTVRPPITPGETAEAPLPSPRTPEPAPVRPGEPMVDQPQDADPNYVVLPGLNRVYPSEDPANQFTDSAPEAFPRPGRAAARDLAAAEQTHATEQVHSAEQAHSADLAHAAERPTPTAPRASTPTTPTQRGDEDVPSARRDEPAPPPASPPSTAAPADRYCVQLFATGSEKIAESRRKSMASFLDLPLHVESENGLWKVRSSAGARPAAQQWLELAVARGYADAFLVPIPGGARP